MGGRFVMDLEEIEFPWVGARGLLMRLAKDCGLLETLSSVENLEREEWDCDLVPAELAGESCAVPARSVRYEGAAPLVCVVPLSLLTRVAPTGRGGARETEGDVPSKSKRFLRSRTLGWPGEDEVLVRGSVVVESRGLETER
jgi:hypothetical protein